MELTDPTLPQEFISAARAVYAQNGYSVISRKTEEPGEIDFWVIAPESDSRTAVRCISAPLDEVTKADVSNTYSVLSNSESLHVITSGKFADDVSSMTSDGKSITLIDGPQVKTTFSALPKLVGKLGYGPAPSPAPVATVPPPLPVNLPESKKKSPLALILTIVAVSGAFVLFAALIVAAIAVPNVGRINEAATNAAVRRNAQNLASIYAASQAAGHNFSDPNKDLNTTLTAIRDGITIKGGIFDGTFFGVPQMTDSELEAASEYLELNGDVLTYLFQKQP